jgi:Glyoxalase-like domain
VRGEPTAAEARIVTDADLELDHVIIAVADLDAAEEAFGDRYGLAVVGGGRHAAWGTANAIIPLGGAYLELITVVEPATAAASAFGRWVASGRHARPIGWVVRTSALDTIARRLGLEPTHGSRTTPDGRVLRWRSAGTEVAAAEPTLPFFIEWDTDVEPPGRRPVTHPVGDVALERLVVAGDAERLMAWTGEAALPVLVRPGTPAVLDVVLSAGGREIVI